MKPRHWANEMNEHDKVLLDLNAATMDGAATPYDMIENAAIAIEAGQIAWVGPRDDLPTKFEGFATTSLGGRLVTPGLIDCHTHVVFGGNRATEFELRLNGASYEEVARAGGGIVSTVKATRAASEEALLKDALTRVDAMINEGVTLIEVKSGYGLNQDTELKMLRVIKRLKANTDARIKATFLGAHAIPTKYKNNRLTGEYKTWWENDTLASLSYYKNGLTQGEEKKWYSTGQLAKLRKLVDGKEHGFQKAWLVNGKLYINYEAKNGRIFGMRRANSCYKLEDEVIIRKKI